MNIYDVAKKSGVSIATISRVLNGGKNVSKKTYDKVMSVIKEEGYTPNVFARGLGLGTMQTIGILVADASDIYYARMISYLTEELHNLGLNVLLSCTGRDRKNKERELKMLLDKKVDAIFLAGSAQQELEGNEHIIAAAKSIPVIMVNGYIKGDGIINVSSNDAAAVRTCVESLFLDGFKAPIYLYNHTTYSGMQKIKGFKEGMTAAGIIDAEECMVQLPHNLPDMKNKVLELLDTDKKFDSVIAAEDTLAIAALKALESKGLSMPVIGYNNSILADVSSPTLTSVDNMLESLCKLAVQLFHDTTAGKETCSHITLECRLVERESYQPKN